MYSIIYSNNRNVILDIVSNHFLRKAKMLNNYNCIFADQELSNGLLYRHNSKIEEGRVSETKIQQYEPVMLANSRSSTSLGGVLEQVGAAPIPTNRNSYAGPPPVSATPTFISALKKTSVSNVSKLSVSEMGDDMSAAAIAAANENSIDLAAIEKKFLREYNSTNKDQYRRMMLIIIAALVIGLHQGKY